MRRLLTLLGLHLVIVNSSVLPLESLSGTKWENRSLGGFNMLQTWISFVADGRCALEKRATTEYEEIQLEASGKCLFDAQAGVVKVKLSSQMKKETSSQFGGACYGPKAKTPKCRKSKNLRVEFTCRLVAAQVHFADHKLDCTIPGALSDDFGKQLSLYLWDETPNRQREMLVGDGQIIPLTTVREYIILQPSEVLYAFRHPSQSAEQLNYCINPHLPCTGSVMTNEKIRVFAKAVIDGQEWLLIEYYDDVAGIFSQAWIMRRLGD